MKDLMGIMKQVRDMQARMQKVQSELSQMEVTGEAGAGLVKVVLTGKGDLKAVSIDPSLMKPEEKDMLEDLILAAVHDARQRLETTVQAKLQEFGAGLALPGGQNLFF